MTRRSRRRRARLVGLCSLLALAAGCGAGGDPAEPGQRGAPLDPARVEAPLSESEAAVEGLRVEVLERRRHPAELYTQGLVLDAGRLFESAGRYGASSLVELSPGGGVLRRVEAPREVFAEGLALVDGRLVQLTWKEGRAFVYDRDTFGLLGEHRYEGEGWGLCYDGRRLVMSDGASRLQFRDPDSFELLGAVEVTVAGSPLALLNELECVAGAVYANVWQSERIVRIDPASGRVTADIDAAGLLDRAAHPNAEVLNGLAYDPADQTFLVTGKLWPELLRVRFVP
ncbi:MAG: glutaminyl-peptide cyclotransferase [Acidimicrobiales bacterium]